VLDDPAAALDVIRQERDLYLRMLELGACEELEPFLREVLELIVRASQARKGYLEFHEPGDDAPALALAYGCEGEAEQSFRGGISQGVMAEALATRTTVLSASALGDPRFRERGSVRRNAIEAVLCTPFGGDPPLGVVYLQGRNRPGGFDDADRARAELFVRCLHPFVERLRIRRRQSAADPTRSFRDQLAASDVIGRSAALARTLQEVALVAPLDVCVLLTGGSGTGKTQIARVLHDSGPRRGRPFVELNCAAIPEALLEAELFGAMPGAHSTATRRIDGKVAAAEGGTLFLDEIGELAVSAQAKLLQLLQSQEYYPLGATRKLRADVRIIAATNTDLQAAIEQRSFRGDLYYRLSVLPIRLPALAERREDVVELAEHFVAQACTKNRLPRLRLSLAARQAVLTAEWPGNVRQLAHAVEGAAIRAAGAMLPEIEPHHLFPALAAPAAGRPPSFQEATRGFQEQLLRATLDELGWNVMETARRLDLSRAHVYNLIGAFSLTRAR
jgi:Nif-specific regulatory protein